MNPSTPGQTIAIAIGIFTTDHGIDSLLSGFGQAKGLLRHNLQARISLKRVKLQLCYELNLGPPPGEILAEKRTLFMFVRFPEYRL